jgi:hypothetical protein
MKAKNTLLKYLKIFKAKMNKQIYPGAAAPTFYVLISTLILFLYAHK